MAAKARDVRVLQVKHSSSDELTVLVCDTAAVLTLRRVKLFAHAGSGGDSCGPGAPRLDIFDVERDAAFVVSDFGVWDVNTSVLDGATLVAKHAAAGTGCCAGAGGDAAGAKRGSGSGGAGQAGPPPPPPPKRRQRTSMV